MDQDAFRQMLQGSGSTSSSSSATQQRSRFGAALPKRPTASTSTGAATDFKPRSAKPKKDKEAFKPKRAPDGSVYRDRAAERRKGKEGDFAEAEKLLEDFKTRSEREDVDTETFQKQLAYLGGDAQHSILVKGLDMALLERMKHEQAKEADKDLDDVEGELDRALEAGPPDDTAKKVEEKAGGGKKKKTRDELLAEMKAMRSGGGAAGGAGAEKDSRFKPLGVTDKGKGKEAAAPLGSGWKKVAAAPAAGEPEKKLRKKKKKVFPAPASAAEASASNFAGSSSAPAAVTPKLPSPAAPPPPPPADDDDDDDDDIFGGAGDYKGLDSDTDEDDSKPSSAAAPPPAAVSSASSKRKYFDDVEDDSAPISTAPSAVTDLAAKQAAADVSGSSRREAGAGEAEAEEGEDVMPARLEGLSGNGPSVRELLDLDKAAEEEDKRKAKKLKYQAKAAEKRELREANMTRADKDNRDFLEMQAYLAKKEGKGGKDGEGGKAE
ncbi:hypothetical protein JCM11251_006108 [Rhodosporidiobolus azoricus]